MGKKRIVQTLARADLSLGVSTIGRILKERERKELSLKNLRMGRVKPRRRPYYRGAERLGILALKAARGWSKSQAAER